MPFIIGIDECGRGAGAGPLTICAFRAPLHFRAPGLRDSKKLSVKQRGEFYEQLVHFPETRHIIIHKSAQEIDRLGLAVCLKKSYIESLLNLYEPGDEAVLDGNLHPRHLYGLNLPQSIPIRSVVRADDIIPAVSAASVIGKYTRDEIMKGEMHKQYPQYGFDHNVGYLSRHHRKAIEEFGLSPEHRHSFRLK